MDYCRHFEGVESPESRLLSTVESLVLCHISCVIATIISKDDPRLILRYEKMCRSGILQGINILLLNYAGAYSISVL